MAFVPPPSWVSTVSAGIVHRDGEAVCKGLNATREDQFFGHATVSTLEGPQKGSSNGVKKVISEVRGALLRSIRSNQPPLHRDDFADAELYVEALARFCGAQALRVAFRSNPTIGNIKTFKALVFAFEALQEVHMRDRSHYPAPPLNRRGSKGTVGWDTVILITVVQYIQHEAQELATIEEDVLGSLLRNWRRLFVFLQNADLELPKEIARRRGALPIMNALLIMFFQHNNTHQCRVLLGNIEERERVSGGDPSKGILGPASHLISETIKFRYYQGRMKLHEKDFSSAFECFRTAYQLSPSFLDASNVQRNNKRRTLFYWVVSGVAMGLRPPPEILNVDSVVSETFTPIIDALSDGNVALYEAKLAACGNLLRKRGVFMLLQQGKLLCWLLLLQRLHTALGLVEGTDNSRVPLDLLVDALHHVTDSGRHWTVGSQVPGQEAPVSAEDAKRIRLDVTSGFCEADVIALWMARLIARGFVRGYLSYEHRVLVLSKKDPFPTLKPR